MPTLEIKRPLKQNKSENLSIRLTPDESAELEDLKHALNFCNMRDLILFCKDITKTFYDFHSSDYRIFVGEPDKDDYKEVKIEF